MTKRPLDKSSAGPPDAAQSHPDQAAPTKVASEATVDVTPGNAGQTLGSAGADRAVASPSQGPPTPAETASTQKLPLGETDTDLGATIDSPRGLSSNTASEAAEEPLDQTVIVTLGQRPPSEEAAGAGQAPTPIGETTGDPTTQHTVTRFLAEGGLGKVYVAQDDKLQREVVLKTLKAGRGDDDEAHHRFVQEAQINSQLEHPNIIPIYQAGEGADGQPYYTMKYVRGQEFRDLIQGYHQKRREGNVNALELRRLLTLYISTCQAVSYAHNRGVVHRDLKPENVAVGEFGELLVLDWGLAKVLGEPDTETSRAAVTIADEIDLGQTMQGRIMGTPGYMAPEQASGERDAIEPRTDVYSLGAILFEILSGAAPHALLHNYDPNQIQRWQRRESHSGTTVGQESVSSLASLHSSGHHENTMKLLARVIAGIVPAPSDLEPTVPRALDAICQCAMSLKIEDRYTTASDLAADVERWLADEPVTVYAGSWNERLGRWMRKHRTKVQAIGASFAVIALVAVISSVLINNQKQLAVHESQRAGVAERIASEEAERAKVAERLASREADNAKEALARQQAAEQDRLVAQVDLFRRAAATAAPVILSELDVTSTDIETVLRDRLKDSSQTDLEENRIRLALLKVDPDQLDPIMEYLQSASGAQMSPAELLLIRGVLETHGSTLTSRFEPLLSDPSQRLRAACMLAGFAPQADWWPSHAENIAADLVRVLPSQLVPYREALRPIQQHLIAPLSTIFRDSTAGEQVRSFATDTLVGYLSDNAERLFHLLAESNQTQFGPVFDKLLRHQSQAIKLGIAEVAKSAPAGVREEDQESWAMRQANAAVMLLRMESGDAVWPLLRHTPDPRVRSYIIHWLSPRGGNAQTIITRYDQETDVTIKRALLLCLGEFGVSDAERETMIGQLMDVYGKDSDAGVHGAAEWTLRQWGQGDQLAALDTTLRQSEEQLRAIGGRPKDGDQPKEWYINGQGQTYVILDAGEFQMGSPESEPFHEPDESLHRRSINRRFAISTKEVTRGQWRKFSDAQSVTDRLLLRHHYWAADNEHAKKTIHTDDSAMGGMIWDEAALYCNWLSEREGIPEDQWCYEKNTGTHPEKFVTTMFLAGVALLVRLTGLFVKHKRLLQSCGWLCIAATLAIGSSAVYDWYCYEQVDRLVMKAKETFWELSGYRLPTEAEWEYACRAGASSSRYYGVSDSLLSRYAWNLSNGDDHMHPVARLKPNDYGLFDMMGNAHEWCIDGRFIYPAPSDKAVPDAPAVKSFRRRELRGGSYKNMPGYIRIANRANDRPDYRYSTFGFRVARTYPSSPSSSIP